jgi:hypothetical protein
MPVMAVRVFGFGIPIGRAPIVGPFIVPALGFRRGNAKDRARGIVLEGPGQDFSDGPGDDDLS